MGHFVSAFRDGEKCSICGNLAAHKVAEEVSQDDPIQGRHELTASVCCQHFGQIFGKLARESCAHAAHDNEEIPYRRATVVSVLNSAIVTVKDSQTERWYSFPVEKFEDQPVGISYGTMLWKKKLFQIKTRGNHVTSAKLHV